MPTTARRLIVDYLGTVSGRVVDKSRLVAWRLGAARPVPLVDDYPVNLECRVPPAGE